jgi:hypothetical protein
MRPARTGSDNARSIEGVRPFQQAGKPNFVRNQLPGSVTLYNRTRLRESPRPGFTPLARPNTAHRSVETTPVSWEYGSPVPVKARLSS